MIVRVDGHAQIPNSYLSLVVEILKKTGAVNVGGVMAAIGVTPFEKAVAGAMRSPLGVGASRFHTGGEAATMSATIPPSLYPMRCAGSLTTSSRYAIASSVWNW